MHYIKVLAIDSTNDELKRLYRKDKDLPNTCLSAEFQSAGKGQRGTRWDSGEGKNLIFSLFIRNISIPSEESFKISALVSLRIQAKLQEIFPEIEFSIKWPNDILSGAKKLGGILIENIWKSKTNCHTIIGIGLNVNQLNFSNLEKATSLRQITGDKVDLNDLLFQLTHSADTYIHEQVKKNTDHIIADYEKQLFRINQTSQFTTPEGENFPGIIRGINKQGRLKVEVDQQIRLFDLKELSLNY